MALKYGTYSTRQARVVELYDTVQRTVTENGRQVEKTFYLGHFQGQTGQMEWAENLHRTPQQCMAQYCTPNGVTPSHTWDLMKEIQVSGEPEVKAAAPCAQCEQWATAYEALRREVRHMEQRIVELSQALTEASAPRHTRRAAEPKATAEEPTPAR